MIDHRSSLQAFRKTRQKRAQSVGCGLILFQEAYRQPHHEGRTHLRLADEIRAKGDFNHPAEARKAENPDQTERIDFRNAAGNNGASKALLYFGCFSASRSSRLDTPSRTDFSCRVHNRHAISAADTSHWEHDSLGILNLNSIRATSPHMAVTAPADSGHC